MQLNQILAALDLASSFDFIATLDDVESGKPNPEIYTLVSGELGATSEGILVIEDSVSGVQVA